MEDKQILALFLARSGKPSKNCSGGTAPSV